MLAAWALTASRSLMKAFSPGLTEGELMSRRWAGARRKRGAERRICRCGNMVRLDAVGIRTTVLEWRGLYLFGGGGGGHDDNNYDDDSPTSGASPASFPFPNHHHHYNQKPASCTYNAD